jgi:hypothetical protein
VTPAFPVRFAAYRKAAVEAHRDLLGRFLEYLKTASASTCSK